VLGFIHFPEWLKPEVIPGLPIRWYGLMYIVAFLITYLLASYQVKRGNADRKQEDVVNFFFWGIIGLLIGARIFATLIYDTTGRYLAKPWLILWPFDGSGNFVGLQGMSYHGGVVGVIVATVIYCRVKKWDFFQWSDIIVAGIPLGYTFGRLGNFINGELYGRVTTVAWGMIFPQAPGFPADEEWVRETARKAGMDIDPAQRLVNLPRHPSQLYEAFFEGIFLWLILWFVFRKRKPFHGFLLGVYIIGYGLVRFVIEYFREPDAGLNFPIQLGPASNPNYRLLSAFNFTTGQILCFLMIFFGGLFLFVLHIRKKRKLAAAESGEMKKPDIRKLRKKIKR